MTTLLKGKRINRIIHMADIHVRLYKRADEFREVFATLDTQLFNLQLTPNDIIVVAGDVIHTKTDMSPEMVDIVSVFFRMLASHTTTIVIAGNHDFLDKNKSRMDALSPIIKNLGLPSLHYFKHSGVTRVGDVDVATMSILDDPSTWPTAHDCTAATKIALFHGPIYSAETDVGFVVTSRHHTLDMFDGFDIALLGDIHTHQVLQEYDPAQGKPIVVYASSLIQQNHGELISGHGFCEWDVQTRSFTFHEVPNAYGMYTIRVAGKTIPPVTDMPRNVRLRLFAGDLDESEIKKYLTTLQLKYNIIEKSITRNHTSRLTRETDKDVNLLDVNNVTYQNKLIVDFINDHIPTATAPVIARVLDINAELNGELSIDDLSRKITWAPKTLKFNNLFTYGESNSIDFDALQGVVGLFAPNASGKSSIPDAICFALYDKTPRTSRGVNIMNTRRDDCWCEFIFLIGDVEYGIERTGKRNKKGEVKIDVDFWRVKPDGSRESLNGEERRVTNDVIRQYVGDFDDFLLTAFSVQDKNSLFIDRGQSDRKDVLNQFMGLKVFDELHQLAKDKSKVVSMLLRQFKNEDFTSVLATTHLQLEEKEAELQQRSTAAQNLQLQLEQIDSSIQHLYEQRIPIVSLPHSIAELEAKKVKWANEILMVNARIQQIRDRIEAGPQYDEFTKVVDARIQDIQQKLERGDIAVTENRQWVDDNADRITQLEQRLATALTEQTEIQHKIKTSGAAILAYQKSIDMLKNHRFNPDCDVCTDNVFVRDAKQAETKIEAEKAEMTRLQEQLRVIQSELTVLENEAEDVAKFKTKSALLHKQELAVEQLKNTVLGLDAERQTILRDVDKKFQALKDSIHTETQNIGIIEGHINKADVDIATHVQQAEAVSFNDQLLANIVQLKTNKQMHVANKDGIEREVKRLHAEVAVLQSQQATLLQKITKAQELETAYEAYEIYQTVMCRDGLPYRLIADVIPDVQIDINNILSQMVEFQVVLELDGKNINGRIVYDDTRTWPLELASGMEKFISGLAIRVALMGVSSLPKSNFLIVDEGFGALDMDTRSSLHLLFTLLKTQFDFILVISHLDSLRDVTDMIIEIARDDGISQIIV